MSDLTDAQLAERDGPNNRHGHTRQPVADDRVRCTCPSTMLIGLPRRCKERATQEDGLCDPCRTSCQPILDRRRRDS